MLNNFKNEYLRLIKYISYRMWSYTTLLILCCATDAFMATIGAALIKDLYDAAVNKQMDSIKQVALVLTISVISLCILSPITNYYFGKTIKNIMLKIKADVYNHVIRLKISEFEQSHSGRFISLMQNDLSCIENVLSSNLRSLISLVFTGISSAIIMVSINSKIAVILFVLAVFSTFMNVLFTNKVRNLSNQIQQDISKSTESLIDIVTGIHVIKIFLIKDSVIKKYMDKNKEIMNVTIKRAKVFALLDSVNFLVMWLNNGGMLVFGIIMILKGDSTVGTVLSLLILQQNIVNLFKGLGNMVVQLQTSLAGTSRVFQILDTPCEKNTSNAEITNIINTQGITIDNVGFSYDDKELILKDLTLDIRYGKMSALVGPSGGGKSTILKLLLGYYPLSLGTIKIFGKEIGQYGLAELRDLIAYVPQDCYLFQGTIGENIAYGKQNATMDDIVHAAKSAKVHDFIISLPEGYDTPIAEMGVNLSGGQKQRITIARSILKNAPILLLDEATSSLDFETEQLVQDALNVLMEGKTILVIAHRLSTIRNADSIYVMDSGRIVEKGTHDELMNLGGTYQRLCLNSQR